MDICSGTEACIVHRKALRSSKAKTSIMQESGAITDITVISVFHIARHLLGNSFTSASSQIYFLLIVLSLSGLKCSSCFKLFQSLPTCRGHQSSKAEPKGREAQLCPQPGRSAAEARPAGISLETESAKGLEQTGFE